MMDEIDMAQQAEASFLAAALANRPAPDPLGPLMKDGVPCCRECEQPIPPARLAAVPGAGLCVSCQAEADGRRA